MTDPTSILTDDTDPSDLDPETLIELIKASQTDLESFLTSDAVTEAVEDVTVTPCHERPNTLTGITQRIETGYDHIYVNINTNDDGDPVELFTTYGQSGGFTKSMTEAIHNLATLALRSNADPEEVIAQLRGIRSPRIGYDHETRVDSIPDAIGLALERVVNDDLPSSSPKEGRQSSLTQHNTKDSHQSSESSNPGTSTPRPDGDADVPLETPDEVSVSGTPDPEIEPTGAPNAELGTDPHLKEEPTTTQSSSQYTTDTEPCPDCGSIEVFYSEGCMTCQDCGYSECG